MIKTIWESPAKNENNEPFFKVKTYKDWYTFGERAGVDSIAFILYDSRDDMYGLINEHKPPLDAYMNTAFGVSLDNPNLTPLEICIEEVQEESGYIVTEDNIQYFGKVLVSTQMNQMCHLYLIDVTNLKPGKRNLGEDEVGSSVVWMCDEDIAKCSDWKAITIMLKSFYRKVI